MWLDRPYLREEGLTGENEAEARPKAAKAGGFWLSVGREEEEEDAQIFGSSPFGE